MAGQQIKRPVVEEGIAVARQLARLPVGGRRVSPHGLGGCRRARGIGQG